uniref:Uncharacterized protein n=1 Tax=Skeletonema marinoi TaxID=267567 RepID=A0A7S2Q2F7_9STRA|mmetsp:Transcript_8349/g.14139  ORF Transcript_8349/g.14139 Transcript_8349/m.14139 type:complete len:487 (+) Transcript_8349:46-1506(+)
MDPPEQEPTSLMIPLPDDSIHHGPGPVRRQILQTMKKSGMMKTQAETAGVSVRNHHYQLGFSGCCTMIVCMLGILFAWVQYFQWSNTLSSTTMPIPAATVTTKTKPNSLPAKDKDAFAKLEIFVSAFPGDSSSERINGFAELQATLIRSLQFFWPLEQLSVTMVCDDTTYTNMEEQENVTSTAKSLFDPNIADKISIKYNTLTNHTMYGRGYYIQQLIMFWADNFTDAEYIGFVDDDTLLSRKVQPYDLFDVQGRPRAIVGTPEGKPKSWTDSVRYSFQWEPKVYGMNYFPVIVHRSLLEKMREYILSQHPQFTYFDEFYMSMIRRNGPLVNSEANGFSQFYMMMDYAYQKHPDEYDWHIETDKCEHFGFPGDHCKPFPRVSVHAGWYHLSKYKTKRDREEFVSEMLRIGYCFSLPAGNHSDIDEARCKKYWTDLNWRGEWQFELTPTIWRVNGTTAEGMRRSHEEKLKSRTPHVWDDSEMQRIFG